MSSTVGELNDGPLFLRKWPTFFDDRNCERVVSSGRVQPRGISFERSGIPFCEFFTGQLM